MAKYVFLHSYSQKRILNMHKITTVAAVRRYAAVYGLVCAIASFVKY